MKREVYLHMNTQLHPSEKRIEEAVRYARRKRHIVLKKCAAIAIAAAALCGSLSIGASASEDFRQMLFDISPEIAATFSPVMESCVSDGIRMTVEAVHLNNDDAEVIVAFEDLTGQNRVESIDLCDSYSLKRGNLPYLGEIGSYGISGEYDPETGIARKHIYIHEPGMIDKEGQTITFSVERINLGMQNDWNVEMPIDLSKVSTDPPTKSAADTLIYNDVYGGIGAGDMDPGDFRAEDQVYLTPGTPIRLAEGVEITAVGWTDGYLHIQVRKNMQLDTTSVGFWLVGDEEERHQNISVLWSPEKGVAAEETFIPMKPEELERYQLHGYIIAGGTEIAGNWKVKFRLEEACGTNAPNVENLA